MNPLHSKRSNQVVTQFTSNKDALVKKGIEPTCNKMGYTYHKIGPSEQKWVSSLPNSSLPLLDVGACYGVQTIYALTLQRDVLAIDVCEEHIAELRRRVAKLDHRPVGNLVGAIVSELPDPHVVADASVSGILCSEVIHFLKPGKLRPLFSHFFRWLAPGGKLVVTAASWPPRINTLVNKGMVFSHKRSVDDVLDLLKNRPPSEVVDVAPGMMWLPKEAIEHAMVGDFLYLMSTEELGELAKSSGFLIEELGYYDAQKCGSNRSASDSETVLLVAKRPAKVV